MQVKKPAVKNEFIDKIAKGTAQLSNLDIDQLIHGGPDKPHEGKGLIQAKEKELLFSNFVIEIEILPKVSHCLSYRV